MLRTSLILCALALVLVSACRDEEEPPTPVLGQDSAWVRVYDYKRENPSLMIDGQSPTGSVVNGYRAVAPGERSFQLTCCWEDFTDSYTATLEKDKYYTLVWHGHDGSHPRGNTPSYGILFWQDPSPEEAVPEQARVRFVSTFVGIGFSEEDIQSRYFFHMSDTLPEAETNPSIWEDTLEYIPNTPVRFESKGDSSFVTDFQAIAPGYYLLFNTSSVKRPEYEDFNHYRLEIEEFYLAPGEQYSIFIHRDGFWWTVVRHNAD